jgi:hypothetical protein
VPLTVDDEAMAVIDWRGRSEIPPSGNHLVAERPLTQKRRVSGLNGRETHRLGQRSNRCDGSVP